MEHYEEVALAKICEAYAQSRPMIEDLIKDHEWAIGFLQMLKFAMTLTPDDVAGKKVMLEHYDHLITHLNGTLGVITLLHGSAMFVNAMVSEHKEPATEDSGGQGR